MFSDRSGYITTSFSPFGLVSNTLYGQGSDEFHSSTSSNDITTTTSPSSASNKQNTLLYNSTSPLENQWDQASNTVLLESFSHQNFFDEATACLAIVAPEFPWDDSLATTTLDTVRGPPVVHTTKADIAGWGPSGQLPLKRIKSEGPNMRSACWTSPICPANEKEGSTSHSCNCEGGCAPYLFDSIAPTEIDWSNDLFAIDEAEPRYQEMDCAESRPIRKAKSTRKGEAQHSSGKKKRKQINKSPTTESTVDPVFQKASTRQQHNGIERKYRESINGHLEALKNIIPSFCEQYTGYDKEGDIEDSTTAPKPSKGAILAGAVSHIKRQRRETLRLEQEGASLRQQVRGLQASMKCGDCSLMQHLVRLNNVPTVQACRLS